MEKKSDLDSSCDSDKENENKKMLLISKLKNEESKISYSNTKMSEIDLDNNISGDEDYKFTKNNENKDMIDMDYKEILNKNEIEDLTDLFDLQDIDKELKYIYLN